MEKLTKKERTKRLIISTSIDLFSKYGIENVTMEQIFSSANIAKGTLYNYFSSKEEIIATYVERSFSDEEIIRISNIDKINSFKEKFIYIFTELTNKVEKNKDLFEYYTIYRMKEMVSFQEEKKSGFSKLSNYLIKEGIKDGEISPNISISFLRDFFDFIFIEIIKQMSLQKGNNKEILIDKYVSIFFDGTSKKD